MTRLRQAAFVLLLVSAHPLAGAEGGTADGVEGSREHHAQALGAERPAGHAWEVYLPYKGDDLDLELHVSLQLKDSAYQRTRGRSTLGVRQGEGKELLTLHSAAGRPGLWSRVKDSLFGAAAPASGPRPAVSDAVGQQDTEEALDGLQDSLRSWNGSQMAPVVPMDLSWMLSEADMWDDLRANASRGGADAPTDPVQQKLLRFDPLQSHDMAAFTSIAYCNKTNVAAWNCTRCHGIAEDFALDRVIYDYPWDLFAYTGYSPYLQAMVIVFRGTDSHSYNNWIQNMHYWRSDYKIPYAGAPSSAYVHTGFFQSYNGSTLAPNISESIGNLTATYPGAPLYILGHSMGGALAAVCALDLRLNHGIADIKVYTYGSPRVGNDVFAHFYDKVIKESYRFTHYHDIVPSVPLQIMGFHHVATEVWIVDLDATHSILGVCDGSGEDPRCHNSVCHLGLCTSIYDHLKYLSSHMYHDAPYSC